jgi:hypothetical protein
LLAEPGAYHIRYVSLAFDEKVILKDVSFTLISGTQRSSWAQAAPASR